MFLLSYFILINAFVKSVSLCSFYYNLITACLVWSRLISVFLHFLVYLESSSNIFSLYQLNVLTCIITTSFTVQIIFDLLKILVIHVSVLPLDFWRVLPCLQHLAECCPTERVTEIMGEWMDPWTVSPFWHKTKQNKTQQMG